MDDDDHDDDDDELRSHKKAGKFLKSLSNTPISLFGHHPMGSIIQGLLVKNLKKHPELSIIWVDIEASMLLNFLNIILYRYYEYQRVGGDSHSKSHTHTVQNIFTLSLEL